MNPTTAAALVSSYTNAPCSISCIGEVEDLNGDAVTQDSREDDTAEIRDWLKSIDVETEWDADGVLVVTE